MPLFRVFMLRRRDRRHRPWQLWWRDPADVGPIRTRQIGPMSERMAERHREAWQAELNGFRDDGVAGPTWDQFRDAFLASAAADLKPVTLAMYRQVLARFEAAGGPRMVSAVDRRRIESYRVGRLGEVSQETVRKDVRHLRAAFAWAVNLKMIDSNPCIGIRFGRRERRDIDAMNTDETARFLAALRTRPTWVWATLRLGCLWGPRSGELARIMREDLDLAGRILRLPAREGRVTPKGGRGRVIPLDAETAGLLQELSHRNGPLLWGPSDNPCRSCRGFFDRLYPAAREILVETGLVARDQVMQFLRRTAETNMRRRGVPPAMIARIIGHGTRVGDEWYDGIGPEEAARQVEEMMRAWSPLGSPGGHQESESADLSDPER